MSSPEIHNQVINVSNGAAEYTWPVTITETDGKDISADAIKMSLGTFTVPGTWHDPDVDPPQTDHNVRVVKLLVNNTYQPGTYWLWIKVTDSPEVIPRVVARIVVN